MIARLFGVQPLLVANVILLALIMLGQADGLPLLAVCAYWTVPVISTLWIAGRYVRDWRKMKGIGFTGPFVIAAIDLAFIALVWSLYLFWPPPFAA